VLACGPPSYAPSLPSSPAVEASSAAGALPPPPSRRASSAPPSALPSSTPHWSKLSVPQTAPDVKTRCS